MFEELRRFTEPHQRIDLSPITGAIVLMTAPRRWGRSWHGWVPEIEFRGRWMDLCRTDFKDDVCTGRQHDPRRESLTWAVMQYLRMCSYGVRLQPYGSFAVIDRFSDG